MTDIPLWPHAADKALVWERYTAGDALFKKLLKDGGSSWKSCSWFGAGMERDTLPGLALWWKKNAVDSHLGTASAPDALRRWQVLSEILWCFEEARKLSAPSGFSPTEIDRISLAARLPEFDEHGVHDYKGDQTEAARSKQVARAYMCVRSFRLIAPSRAVEIPIALVDGSAKTAFIATLTLELMPGGTGEIAPHLGAAFDTIYHTAFEVSLERAWRMAGGTHANVDGRWWLRRGTSFTSSSGTIALDAVDGPSAGGAAARGWWHLLNEKVPDPEIVVMAQISKDEASFETVDYVSQKALAVATEGRTPEGHLAFDTIVVVGNAAKQAAESSLGSSSDIRVVPLN
jgi:hypothetical protein